MKIKRIIILLSAILLHNVSSYCSTQNENIGLIDDIGEVYKIVETFTFEQRQKTLIMWDYDQVIVKNYDDLYQGAATNITLFDIKKLGIRQIILTSRGHDVLNDDPDTFQSDLEKDADNIFGRHNMSYEPPQNTFFNPSKNQTDIIVNDTIYNYYQKYFLFSQGICYAGPLKGLAFATFLKYYNITDVETVFFTDDKIGYLKSVGDYALKTSGIKTIYLYEFVENVVKAQKQKDIEQKKQSVAVKLTDKFDRNRLFSPMFLRKPKKQSNES